MRNRYFFFWWWLSIVVMSFGLSFGLSITFGQQLQIFTENAAKEKSPRDIILACGLTGQWATISRFSKHDKEARGFDPSYTVIFCKYKPIIKKVGDTYQITFTSEITENLP